MFLGGNSMVEAICKGLILVKTQVKSQVRRIRAFNVLHVPNLHANLFSMSKLVSKGLKVHFNMMGYIVRGQDGELLAMA